MKSPRTGGDRGEGGDFQSGNVVGDLAPNSARSQRPKGVVTGFHDALGELYAAFDSAAAHVDPGVRTSRFAA